MGAAQFLRGMATADVYGEGAFFSAGFRGEVELVKVKWIDRSKKDGLNRLIFEFRIVTSNSDADPVGATRSWVHKDVGNNRYAFGESKKLAFALLGADPDRVGQYAQNPGMHDLADSLVTAAADEEYAKEKGLNPNDLCGRKARLETWQKPTQKGGVFTSMKWQPTDEAAAALKSAMGGGQ